MVEIQPCQLVWTRLVYWDDDALLQYAWQKDDVISALDSQLLHQFTSECCNMHFQHVRTDGARIPTSVQSEGEAIGSSSWRVAGSML